jgi:hypothetical protein
MDTNWGTSEPELMREFTKETQKLRSETFREGFTRLSVPCAEGFLRIRVYSRFIRVHSRLDSNLRASAVGFRLVA